MSSAIQQQQSPPMTRQEVFDFLDISRHVLVEIYRKKCDPNGGVPLVPALGQDGSERYCRRTIRDIKRILDVAEQEGRWVDQTGRYVDMGEALISTERALRELRLVRPDVTDMALVGWRNNRCAHLGGKKMYSAWLALTRNGRRAPWHSEKHIEAVKKSLAGTLEYNLDYKRTQELEEVESAEAVSHFTAFAIYKHHSGPNPNTTKLMEKAGLIQAKVVPSKSGGSRDQRVFSLRAVLAAWEVWKNLRTGKYQTSDEALLDFGATAKELGVAESYVQQLAREGKLLATQYSYQGRRSEGVISEDVVREFKRRFYEARNKKPPGKPWEKTLATLTLLGFPIGSRSHIEAHIRLISLRKKLLQDGKADGLVGRFRTERKDQNQQAWYWNMPKLKKLLNGRSLLELPEAEQGVLVGQNDQASGNQSSDNSSDNSKKKPRGAYKIDQVAKILKLVTFYCRRGENLKDSFTEIATDLELTVDAVKRTYYRYKSNNE